MRRDLSAYAPLVLRLMLGIGYVVHGWPKLAWAHAGFTIQLTAMGIPAPKVMSWVVGLLEVFGGVLLIAGAFTTIVSALLIVNMLVALFKVHLASGFNFVNVTSMTEAGPQFGMPGYEPVLLYIAMLLSLILSGPGAFALQRRRAMGPAGGMGSPGRMG